MKNISDWVIENNHQYLVANKPAGVPVQSDKTKDADLLTALQAYTKKDLKLINRIDRPVSGCVLLGKSLNATKHLSKSPKVTKTYLALVEPNIKEEQGTIKAYLSKAKNNKAHVSDTEKEGFLASEMSYRLVHSFDKYQLVEITLHTGRFHQIRSLLAHHGACVKGDVKYGARRSNKDRSIGLHAWKIKLDHPVSAKMEEYIAPLPDNDILWKLSNDLLNK